MEMNNKGKQKGYILYTRVDVCGENNSNKEGDKGKIIIRFLKN